MSSSETDCCDMSRDRKRAGRTHSKLRCSTGSTRASVTKNEVESSVRGKLLSEVWLAGVGDVGIDGPSLALRTKTVMR